jgi:Zn-dependent metalloprotease
MCVCSVVPPHMLKHIAQKGNPKQRKAAKLTLDVTKNLKFQRKLMSRHAMKMPTLGKNFGPNRIIHDAQHARTYDGTIVRREGETDVADATVNAIYADFGHTFSFYSRWGRNSYDNRGAKLKGVAHYSQSYNNAFWDGVEMVFGDGDGELFTTFTTTDIIGHELTHAVTEYTANLVYENQPGALNEHMSDVMGALVKQRSLMQKVDQADWLVGAGILGPTIKGEALRSMKAPGTAYDDPILGKDPQPAHMRDFYVTTEDEGGVHINSGIPNYAFYVAAMEIGGYGWEKAGRIWYRTLRDKMNANMQFADAAKATTDMAAHIYRRNSKEHKAVLHGWQKVGLL